MSPKRASDPANSHPEHKAKRRVCPDADVTSGDYEDILVGAVNSCVTSVLAGDTAADAKLKKSILDRTNAEISLVNSALAGPDRLPRLRKLAPIQIAILLIELHNVVRITPIGRAEDRDSPLLGIYVEDPEHPNFGCYDTSDAGIWQVARRYSVTLDERGWKQVRDSITPFADARNQCVDRDLVPVANGVFNYRTKNLTPFTPELVFLNKVRVPFNKNASRVTITQPDGSSWDVDSWVETLSDDPEVVALLWELLGAVTRPYVRWNKAALLSNSTGNNGKGTFLSLMQNLVGVGGYVSMPIANFSKEFLLEPLLKGGPILTHENPVGAFSSEADAFKCVVTNDEFTINRKNRTPVQHQHWGLMVQCVNGLPKFKDRSESLLRRILLVTFDKHFTRDTERREIKDDYLTRPEVLEYVLKRVLLDLRSYYELSEPAACRDLLGQLRENNDPVAEFWNEHSEQFAWDLLPFDFLFDCFVAWFAKTNPSGNTVSKRSFVTALLPLVELSEIWQCEARDK